VTIRADAPAKKHRVVALFAAQRARLAAVSLLAVGGVLLGIASPFLIKRVFDDALFSRRGVDEHLLVELVAALVAVTVVQSLFGLALSYMTVSIGQTVVHRLRVGLFESLYRLPLQHFMTARAGDLQSRMSNDVNGVLFFLTSVSTMTITAGTTIVGVFAAMFLLSWKLTLATLVVLPPFLLTSKIAGAKKRDATTRRQAAFSELTSLSQESLSPGGVQQARLFGRSDQMEREFSRRSERVARTGVEQWMMGNVEANATSTLFALLPVLAFGVVGLTSGNQQTPALSVGTLAAFVALQSKLYWPLTNTLQLVVNAKASSAYFERIFEFADAAPDPALAGQMHAPSRPRGDLVISSVDFAYDHAVDEPALQGVSFQARRGGVVAVVGSSGSGKSTLAHLIAGLYRPLAGTVKVDGIEVSSISPAERSRLVSLMSQDVFLFHDTVRNNLLFAHAKAEDRELFSATRAAGIHDRIAQLPDGYETIVGDRGLRFSVGERQRLALARVLLRDPAVVVLDEFTSSLDSENEDLLHDTMRAFAKGGKTVITVTHRLSTVAQADAIYVLDRGRVVEVGTHHELLAVDGRYAALYSVASGVDDLGSRVPATHMAVGRQ
jgi:ATP-binding cassette subfamily B protein